MISFSLLAPLFTMGLVSSTHCIGMCGGIMGALTMAIPAEAAAKRWKILLAYNLGRITSYAVMGALVGLMAVQLANWAGITLLRVMAGLLLIATGLYLADWWRGLTYLERAGRYLWVYVQPLGKRLMPVDGVAKALVLGAIWGWLPCGLVYSALAMAMTTPDAVQSAAGMAAFGLGTLPAVLAAGVAAQQWLRLFQKRSVRVVLALTMILFGLWTLWGASGHAGHEHHHHDASAASMPAMEDHSQHHHHE